MDHRRQKVGVRLSGAAGTALSQDNNMHPCPTHPFIPIAIAGKTYVFVLAAMLWTASKAF